MRPALRVILALIPLLSSPAACGGGESTASSSNSAKTSETDAKAADANARAAPEQPTERPLPSFDGRTLDGQRLAISSLIGKRLVLFFFNPEVEEAIAVADAVAAVAVERRKHNFGVVGIAVGSNSDKARRFAAEHELDFPIFDDSNARITSRLGLRAPVVLLAVDPEGFLRFGMGAFPSDARDAARGIEAQLREHLRLPSDEAEAPRGALDQRPIAPLFDAERLEGGQRFRLAELRGSPVVLVFFLHTCPHCHKALRFIREQLEKLPEQHRPKLVGISLQDRVTAVRSALKEQQLDFFPVLLDSDQSIRASYGVFGGVPDVLLIDAEGRIVHRVHGWGEERDPALVRMFLAKLAGSPVPMLLNPKGYTGSDVCGVCHEAQQSTWLITPHAAAFDTLVTHAADRDSECVGCHVVGFDQPGGYTLASRPSHLEAVGCEICHGRGGPHLTPEAANRTSYREVCSSCHDPKHSLGFDYETFLPQISHRAIASASVEERAAMRAGRGAARGLLPSSAKIVGSDACQSCHTAEYETWATSSHAHATKSLEKQGRSDSAECLRCHTTGFGRDGGFPEGAKPPHYQDLARVGCESCHGPGGDHVVDGSRKIGSVVSLGDKCDSCVILQICGSCHDDANDPDFRFQVEARIDRQRHGTIEAGTGRPLSSSPQETSSLDRQAGSSGERVPAAPVAETP